MNQEIDILIGSDLWGQLMKGGIVHHHSGLTAVETVFGWTLCGPVPHKNAVEQSFAMTALSLFVSHASVSELWSLENIGIRDPIEVRAKHVVEDQVLRNFQESVARNEDGRYKVGLPWKLESVELPDNKETALLRLKNTTKKLKNEGTGMYEAYDEIFQAWLEEGIIETVENTSSKGFYLPHRPVFKPSSSTTPVRPVFDASHKSGRAPSLNECLEKGPNLLEKIPHLLMRFREKALGVSADIRKAFQMIEVTESDRDYLRFLWWEHKGDEDRVKIFRHRRVVFGVIASPFLLQSVIEYHLKRVDGENEKVAKQLLRSFYVDNCVTSVDNIEQYEEFREKATTMMSEAQMLLRQWECTGERFVSSLGKSEESTTILGMTWNKMNDTLACVRVETKHLGVRITKKQVLSIISKLFDPIGHTSPALIIPKLAMQDLWVKKLNWDEPVPEQTEREVRKWINEVGCLAEIDIPRRIMDNARSYQLHCFCDASANAYAAVIFARIQTDEKVVIRFLLAKAKIAPLSRPTIPRLELLSCLIGARLVRTLMEALDLEDADWYLWSDSSTALAWIKRNDAWGTFVGNRVKEICEITNPKDWRHIPGTENPADLPSRGCSPVGLLRSRWWEGPDWLCRSQEEWPHVEIDVDEEAVTKELKQKTSSSLLAKEECWYIKRFSSYEKTIRVVGWVKRFVDKCQRKSAETGSLTVQELENAEKEVFKEVQRESFPDDGKAVSLKVVRSEDGVLHVHTRLLNRDDTPGFKFPVLLPHSHELVHMLIMYEHRKNGHAGTQILMAILREKVWILRARKTVQSVLRKCVICRRHASKSVEVVPAPLPSDRVSMGKVFQVTGVDLAGPLYLRNGSKTWIVLFTCAVYRSVHLELVDSLSTEAFLLAFTRFIARRGRPSTVYSDNGTNFVGAVNLFKGLDWAKIERESGLRRIAWKFNPPSAAWWGGWWERIIRILKGLLKRMLGNRRVNFVQLFTMVCEIESVVNSRPLTYMAENDELLPLTPAMFMNNVVESRFPEAWDGGDSYRQGYATLKVLRKELDMRFRKEYLAQLVHRRKLQHLRSLKEDDIVLVGSDNKKRFEWPLARILELIPGKDGNIRVAKLKTRYGTIIRPLQRLFPLELSPRDIL